MISTNATVHDSKTGNRIGDVSDFDFELYEDECTSPEGHVEAGRVLCQEQCVKLGIFQSHVIFVTKI